MLLQNHSKVDSASALILSSLSFLWISFAALTDEQEPLAFAFALVLVEVAPLVLLLVLL